MRLGPGAALGPNDTLAPLGAGGMGEVHRAREAQVLASLNHPNIAQIYGLEEGPPEGND